MRVGRSALPVAVALVLAGACERRGADEGSHAPEMSSAPAAPGPAAEPELAAMDEDGDGRWGAQDRCPNEPELFNGVDDDDGCADEARGLVLMQGPRLELVHPSIVFGADSAQLQPRSEALVDEIARLVLRNGHLGVLHVEVHTDSMGSTAHNLDLSRRRAESIRARLGALGVPAARVKAEGFGEQVPISHCADDEPRCSRRVELWFERPSVHRIPVPSPHTDR